MSIPLLIFLGLTALLLGRIAYRLGYLRGQVDAALAELEGSHVERQREVARWQ